MKVVAPFAATREVSGPTDDLSTSDHPTALILAGGGLANGLIAYRLSQLRPDVPFILIEGGAQLGGRHTWSFFSSDLGPERDWIAPFITRSWDQYEVRFPKRRRRIGSGYRSITSERFNDLLSSALGDRAMTSTPIAALGLKHVELTDGRRLGADVVVDGRGPTAMPDLALGYQKFLGQTVRLAADHGLKGPIIMDATVDQGEGYRFLYVLPWDDRTLLIEDTRYTDGLELDEDDFRTGVREYAAAQGWTIDAVVDEERGVLPVALEGDIDAHWNRAEGRVMSGLRAALFHPTTGYSLPDAAALADSICTLPVIDGVSVEQLIRERSIELWKSRGFFRLVNRMLFRAGRPGERYKVLERFYGLREPLIRRFYADRLTQYDKFRILCGKPPVPFFAALHCIQESGGG